MLFTKALPLLWLPLLKKGNSDTQERQKLISQFLHLFGLKRLKNLTADREFIGERWLEWLLEQGINPYLRIKKNTLITKTTNPYLCCRNSRTCRWERSGV